MPRPRLVDTDSRPCNVNVRLTHRAHRQLRYWADAHRLTNPEVIEQALEALVGSLPVPEPERANPRQMAFPGAEVGNV